MAFEREPPVRRLGFVPDRTPAREGGDAARRAQLLHRHAAGSWLILDGRGAVSEVGPSFVRLAPPGSVLGRRLVDLVRAEDRDPLVEALRAVARDPDEVGRAEFWLLHGAEPAALLEATITNAIGEPSIGGLIVNVTDVTDMRVADLERRAAEERFQLGFEHAAIGMAMLDPEHRITKVNAAFESLLGAAESALVGQVLEHFVHPEDASGQQRDLEVLLAGAVPTAHGERRLRRSDGRILHVTIDVARVPDPSGLSYLFCQVVDVSDRKEVEDRLHYQGLHDPLTGLANRLLLQDRLERSLARAESLGWSVGLGLLDLDRFALVNDSLGQLVGDDLLVELARRLQAIGARGDTVARVGSDQFALVREMPHEGDLDALRGALESVFAAPFVTFGRELRLSASFGLVVAEGGTSADDALRDADAALGRAKLRGGSRVETFDATLRQETRRRFRLEQALAGALERGELRVAYQPVVELATRRLVGAEALLRWEAPAWGSIAPEEFIATAESTGLIAPIGAFVLAEALGQVMTWRRELQGAADLWVAVNLSARQFLLDDPARRCAQALDAAGAPPGALRIELTESAIMEEVEAAIRQLRRLRELGVDIAVDDFGTGHSSLSYLTQLPISSVKIDQSFLGDRAGCPEPSPVLQAIVSLCHAMGFELCAEGIETEGQRRMLADLRCQLGQGYLFAPALAPDAFRARVVSEPRERTARRGPTSAT